MSKSQKNNDNYTNPFLSSDRDFPGTVDVNS